MAPVLSVCIPCLNEEAVLPLCLASIQASAGTHTVEVILADNGSTDRSPALAQQWGARVLHLPEARTIAALRNAAARAAQGEWLVFTDADCVMPAQWVESGLALAKGKTLFGAHYTVRQDAHWAARTWYNSSRPKAGEVSYIPTSNLWIPAGLFRQIDGFNEQLQSDEDSDLCARARAAGARIVAEPALAVCHLGSERSLGLFFKRQLWHGKAVARTFFNNLPRLTNIRAMAIAVFFLTAGVGAVMAAPFSALWCGVFAGAMIAAACLMAFQRGAAPRALPLLTVLCLVYGVARAASLVGLGLSHSPRGRPAPAPQPGE